MSTVFKIKYRVMIHLKNTCENYVLEFWLIIYLVVAVIRKVLFLVKLPIMGIQYTEMEMVPLYN